MKLVFVDYLYDSEFYVGGSSFLPLPNHSDLGKLVLHQWIVKTRDFVTHYFIPQKYIAFLENMGLRNYTSYRVDWREVVETLNDDIILASFYDFPVYLDFVKIKESNKVTNLISSVFYFKDANERVTYQKSNDMFEFIELDDLSTIRTMISDLLSEKVDNKIQGTDLVVNSKSGIVIRSENVRNCKIYGPCYISEGSFIQDCTILPYTYIYKSDVRNSTILNTSIIDSLVKDSDLDESIVVQSQAITVNLQNSIISGRSLIHGKK